MGILTELPSAISMADPLKERVMVCVRFGGSAPNRLTGRPTHWHNRDLREVNHQPRLRFQGWLVFGLKPAITRPRDVIWIASPA